MQNAAMERQSGAENERRQRIKTAQVAGMQKAAMAANGISLTDGTALDTLTDTAELGEMDALMLRYDSEKRAKAYEQQASNLTSQSYLTKITGANAYKSGLLSAGATGLGGLSKVATKWSDYGTKL